jgi:hypothetical protein
LHRIDLAQLPLPRLDLNELAAPFSVPEITAVITASPSGRAPGPDGFGAAFYKATWNIIGADVMRAFHALWNLDFRSFHCLNEAAMVLLHKTQTPAGLKDYRPISLIHCHGPTAQDADASGAQRLPPDQLDTLHGEALL